MVAELRADAALNPVVRLTTLGKSIRGRSLWAVRLGNPVPNGSRRILVLCRQHGDEPASTEAALRLIKSVAEKRDPALQTALSHVTLYLVPMVNPDGAGANTRLNANGADLNRDWGAFSQPETRAVVHAARLIRPNLIIDAHNWDGKDTYNADCLEAPRASNSPALRVTQAIQSANIARLANNGFAVAPTRYGADSPNTLAHRWFVAQGIPALLIETHAGDSDNHLDFRRRQDIYLALIRDLACYSAARYSPTVSREAVLFPSAIPSHPAALPRRPFPWGLAALCVYGFVLWACCPLAPNLALPQRLPVRRYSYRPQKAKAV